jgi:hypothetical protein
MCAKWPSQRYFREYRWQDANFERRQAMKRKSFKSVDNLAVDRRRFLGAALGACAISPLSSWSMQLAASMSGSLTKEQRDSMTPSQVIDELKKGNERFRAVRWSEV